MADLEEDDYDYSGLDRLTKQKIGNPNILRWVEMDTEKRRSKRPYAVAFILLFGIGTILWVLYNFQGKELPAAAYFAATAKIRWQAAGGVTDSLVLKDMIEDTAYPAGAFHIAMEKNQVFVFPWRDPATVTKDTLNYRFDVGGSQPIQVFFPDSSKWKVFPGSDVAFVMYPRGIIPKERQIACNGEALFYIKANRDTPTVIKTLKQEVMVLGTLFEVRDFKAEDTSAVFCYSGSVSVKDSARVTRILDGAKRERATVQSSGGIKVSRSDFPDVTWSSPDLAFDFSNDDLETAMKEIARWYGISKVIYLEPIDKKTRGMVFTGEISRYLTLQQLLSIIERDDLHFSIKGNAILVGRTRP